MAQFACAGVNPSGFVLPWKCGTRETVLASSEDRREQLLRWGSGHFDIVIEYTGSQDELALAVDICGISIFSAGIIPCTLDFKIDHLWRQKLAHTFLATDIGRIYVQY